MKKFMLNLLCLSTLSCSALAEQVNFQKWQVDINNETSHSLQLVTNFPADWFNPDDGMQFDFPKTAVVKNDVMKVSVPANSQKVKMANIEFLTYGEDPTRELSTHMILFSVKSASTKKELCKIAFIGEIKSNQARIEKVLSNDINCKIKWNQDWYLADTQSDPAPVITIDIKEITERQ